MKKVTVFNKVNGKQATVKGVFENVSNDSDLASILFQEIGFPNLDENINFEQVFENNETVESEYYIAIIESVNIENYIILNYGMNNGTVNSVLVLEEKESEAVEYFKKDFAYVKTTTHFSEEVFNILLEKKLIY